MCIMFSFLSRTALTTIAALTVLAGAAQGQSLTGNVGSAGITKGEQSFETRFGISDVGDSAGRVHYDYAFTGWYQLRLIGSFSRPDGDDLDFSGLTVENWFQWSEEADDNSGFNGGLRFAYTYSDQGEPDEAEVRLTATDKFADGWEWRANLIGELEVGSGREEGLALQTRAQLSRALNFSALSSDDWRLGVELFSELGSTEDIPSFRDQAHQVGPVVKVSWENGFYLQTAVRVGLTEGSDDAMAKLFIGQEF